MGWSFDHMQADDGGSVYLRLSTRMIDQASRSGTEWQSDALRGGYWLHPPRGTHAIVYMGAIAPEAIAAWNTLAEGDGRIGLLAITSPDLLHREWSAAQASRAAGVDTPDTQVERLLRPLGAQGRLVTIVDGSPAALSWMGAVLGQRVHALGVDRFGQTGDLPDLYQAYGLDEAAIVRAARSHFR